MRRSEFESPRVHHHVLDSPLQVCFCFTDPERLKIDQLNLCRKLDLKGALLFQRGIKTVPLKVPKERLRLMLQKLRKIAVFADIDFKESEEDGKSFPRLSVKIVLKLLHSELEQVMEILKLVNTFLLINYKNGLMKKKKKIS